jgi:AraC family carnitine catabolism transcriptional activator
LSLDGRPVEDDNGILIQPDAALEASGALGTLIVCSDIRPERFYSARLKHRLHALDRAGVTLGGLDTGCFVLARAGLLKGCRVTLHWEVIDAFRERFPEIELHPTLFEIGNRRLSCAGGTAVLDMMLNAIALDHGVAVAQRVAEHCLHEHIRNGASWQRMALPLRSGAHHPKLVKALRLLEERGDAPLTVGQLARELRLSTRHVLRLFKQHLRESPQRYHQRLRLERARGLLMQTDLTVTQVAQACGFPSAAHFARAYRRQFGRTPSATRRTPPAAQGLTMDRER